MVRHVWATRTAWHGRACTLQTLMSLHGFSYIFSGAHRLQRNAIQQSSQLLHDAHSGYKISRPHKCHGAPSFPARPWAIGPPPLAGLLLVGQEEILNCFEDRRDGDCNARSLVTDSTVFGQIFCRLFRQAHCDMDAQLMTLVDSLLPVVNTVERRDALRFSVGLGFLE